MNCYLCHRTAGYKSALAAEVARVETINSQARALGLDPEKPLAQWTPEEVDRWVAFRDADKH